MAEVLRVLRPVAGDSTGLGADRSAACAEALRVDGLAVSLTLERGSTELVWCSGLMSARFEDMQFTLGVGPGPDAIRTGGVVQVPDFQALAEMRWPPLRSALDGIKVGAVFSFPLAVGAIQVGVMTAVRARPLMLTRQQTDDALVLAHALTALFLSGGGGDSSQTLRRAVVHQATGMVSAQLGVPLAEALLRLRAFAYGSEREVGAVAEDVVARRLRFQDDGNGPLAPRGERG
ncbi:ANTAR domain-containing protein [Streptomyces sp. E11-3]|uniref:ANTAR domain-containing protein n=1 Tax=Streptomyces sp. E11-3 TaxID=3110112 RepID=UPI0039806F40